MTSKIIHLRQPDPTPPRPAAALPDPRKSKPGDIVVYACAGSRRVIGGTVIKRTPHFAILRCNAKVYGNAPGEYRVKVTPGYAPTWCVWFAHQRAWAFRLLPVAVVNDIAA